MTRMNNRLRLD